MGLEWAVRRERRVEVNIVGKMRICDLVAELDCIHIRRFLLLVSCLHVPDREREVRPG